MRGQLSTAARMSKSAPGIRIFGGPLLIHAGLHWHAVGSEELSRRMGIAVPTELPLGGIIGLVEIVDCVQEHPSPWFEGPYGFVLRNPRPLPFTPCPGHLGFYDVPPATLVKLQLVLPNVSSMY